MLPSQGFLLILDSVCAHNVMDFETVSQNEGSFSDKPEWLQNAYVPENNISPEVYTLLAAAEKSFALRVDDPGAADMDIDCISQELTLQAQSEPIESSCPVYELGTPSAPPKRFYTTFWRSITLRIMAQMLQAP